MVSARHMMAMIAFVVYLAGVTGPCICMTHSDQAPAPTALDGCCPPADEGRLLIRGTCCCADEPTLAPHPATAVSKTDPPQRAYFACLLSDVAQASTASLLSPMPLPDESPPTLLPWRVCPGLRAPPPTAA